MDTILYVAKFVGALAVLTCIIPLAVWAQTSSLKRALIAWAQWWALILVMGAAGLLLGGIMIIGGR